MTFMEDQSAVEPGLGVAGPLYSIGWLAPLHPFPKGRCENEFMQGLFSLCVDPWQPRGVNAGYHRCEWCILSGGPGSIVMGNESAVLGANIVYVPGRDRVFVAPSLILHYCDSHEYLPPVDFRRAVTACPPMKSLDYFKALRAAGLVLSKHV